MQKEEQTTGGVVGDSSRGRREREAEGKSEWEDKVNKTAKNEGGVWCGVVVEIWLIGARLAA